MPCIIKMKHGAWIIIKNVQILWQNENTNRRRRKKNENTMTKIIYEMGQKKNYDQNYILSLQEAVDYLEEGNSIYWYRYVLRKYKTNVIKRMSSYVENM